jgi:hypothetical protein
LKETGFLIIKEWMNLLGEFTDFKHIICLQELIKIIEEINEEQPKKLKIIEVKILEKEKYYMSGELDEWDRDLV